MMASENAERKDPTSFLPEEPMVYEFKKKKKKKRKHKQEDPFKDIADVSKPVVITTELDPEVTEEIFEAEVKLFDPKITIKEESIEVDLDFQDYDNDAGPLLEELDQEPAVPIAEDEKSRAALLLTFENVISNNPIVTKKETEPAPDLHKCPTCHFVFKTVRTLNLHQRRKHKVFKKNFTYACKQCSLTYDKRNSLIAHIKRKHSPNSVPYDCENRVCDICALVFRGIRRLRMHKQRKHGTYADEFKFECVDCGLAYDNDSSLKAHRTRKHSTVKRKRIELLPCPVCPSVFRNRETYMRHIQRKHHDSEGKIPKEILENLKEIDQTVKDIHCKQCPLMFSSMTYLRLHMRRKHNAIDDKFSLKCPICCLSYDKIESLKKHIQRKHGDGTHCNECNKDFDNSEAFMSHSHKRPIIECNICGLIFATTGGLKKHKRCTHKIESGVRKFVCYMCKEAFHLSRQLANHLRCVHLKISIPCKFCSKSFKTKDSYKRHCERFHANQYTPDSKNFYKCFVCPLDDFLTESDLSRHIHTAHSRPNDIKIENGPKIKTEEGIEISEQKLCKDETRTYQCTKCEVNSETWQDLRKHYEKTHHVVKKTQCQACGKFIKEADLPKHMKSVHPVEVEKKCPYCEFVTTSRISLMQHTLRHKNATTITCEYQGCKYKSYFQAKMDKHKKNHLELGNRKLQCSKCPFQSMNKYILKYHEEAHATGIKKYTCDHCDYSATLPVYLVQHRLKHSVEKKFKCEYCPFASKYNTSLRFHVKKKHCDLGRQS